VRAARGAGRRASPQPRTWSRTPTCCGPSQGLVSRTHDIRKTEAMLMLRYPEDVLCRGLDREVAWVGLRRLMPSPGRPYTSTRLLQVCLLIGLPLAAVTYAAAYATCYSVARSTRRLDDTAWLPRAAAWFVFVLNLLLQGLSCWAWNRRASRSNPGAFRRERASGHDGIPV
jgi:hypothetical protein